MARVTKEELENLKSTLTATQAESSVLLERLKIATTKFELAVSTIATNTTSSTANTKTIGQLKDQAEEATAEIEAQLVIVDTNSEKITTLAKKVDAISVNLANKEAQLKLQSEKTTELNSIIQGLLPGAASAGLASAFRLRKESYQKPIKLWSFVFIGSIVALIFFATVNPISFTIEQITEANFYKYFLLRLPFIGPTIWLAIYAAKRHGQSLRLEEEYAHKEAISMSFEGYKKQLLEIEASDSDNTSTVSLISKALDALALHPGRVYEHNNESITPLDALKDVVSIRREKSGEPNA